MADLEFYGEDSDDNNDDGYGFENEVEDLSPLQKLERYIDSDNIFNRQMLARGLLDTLRAVYETEDNCIAVLDAMSRLSEDPEPSVRSELMEQVPHIAVYCQKNREAFVEAVPKYILPMVVRYLNDANSQVRKTSQAALLVLLEQGLVAHGDVEAQVIGVILELAEPESLDEYRSEAAALMSKMAPLLGKDITERLFLPRFSEMCTDPLFHVRKVCAANFGEVASVVGDKNCEEYLLAKFYFLCEDGVWGVRKACAECFMTVSCAVSLDTRRKELANLFVNLLCDQSRWVRMSAFQQLGPFISTFADAEKTGLCVNEDGNLMLHSFESSLDGDEILDHLQGTTLDANDGDIRGVLNLESLDPPGTSQESSTDDDHQPDQPNQTDQSGESSQILDEDMDIDEPGEAETATEQTDEHTNKDEDKSLEELRLSSTGQQIDSSVDGPDIKQSDICDSSSSSNHDNTTTTTENLSTSPTQTTDDITTGDNNGDSPTPDSVLSTSPTSDSKDTHIGSGDSNSTEANGCSVPSEKNAPNGDTDNTSADNSNGSESGETSNETTSSGHSSGKIQIQGDNDFNSFQYWRPLLPSVNIDLDIINGQPSNIHVVSKVKTDESNQANPSSVNVLSSSGTDSSLSYSSSSMTSGEDQRSDVRIHTAHVNTVSDGAEETVASIGTPHVVGGRSTGHSAVIDGVVTDMSALGLSPLPPSMALGTIGLLDDAHLAQQQAIVPSLLLENYLGMVDPSRAQTVDGEITRHCAYNLPAVALTLGRQHWPCIKGLYETLAQDMQWKVRRTLAFSMHQLALIVGEDITHSDLVPVFDGFLKDLDEVRIGVLKHLGDIFKLLRPDVRLQYLSRVHDFMKTDNHRNWRFREELAEQLVSVSQLFPCADVCRDIAPVAMALCGDKVAQVRVVALQLMASILQKAHEDGEKQQLAALCNNIIREFATGEHWLHRQTFAQLGCVCLGREVLPPNVFAQHFLPSLLALGGDGVPNVRIALAKCVSAHLSQHENFSSAGSPYANDLLATQELLQNDSDRDVRWFSLPHCDPLTQDDLNDPRDDLQGDLTGDPHHDLVPV